MSFGFKGFPNIYIFLDNINELRYYRIMILSFKDKETELVYNEQWRICFTWENNNAHNVEIVDYH